MRKVVLSSFQKGGFVNSLQVVRLENNGGIYVGWYQPMVKNDHCISFLFATAENAWEKYALKIKEKSCYIYFTI